MSRQSSVKTLPKDILKSLNELIREGKWTLDEMREHLAKLGAKQIPSRSALGRYQASVNTSMEQYRHAQELAGVWTKKLSEDPEGDVGGMATQLLEGVAWLGISRLAEDGGDVKPNDISTMARAIRDVESAKRSATDREIRIREKIRIENQQKLKDLAENSEASSGIDPNTLAEVRRILGTG